MARSSVTMCSGSRRIPGSYGRARMLILQGNAVRPKASRGVRGPRGGQGGVRSGQRVVLPEQDNFKVEAVEERVSDRGLFEEFGINSLEEVCQCEGIPGRESQAERDAIDHHLYMEALRDSL